MAILATRWPRGRIWTNSRAFDRSARDAEHLSNCLACANPCAVRRFRANLTRFSIFLPNALPNAATRVCEPHFAASDIRGANSDGNTNRTPGAAAARSGEGAQRQRPHPLELDVSARAGPVRETWARQAVGRVVQRGRLAVVAASASRVGGRRRGMTSYTRTAAPLRGETAGSHVGHQAAAS